MTGGGKHPVIAFADKRRNRHRMSESKNMQLPVFSIASPASPEGAAVAPPDVELAGESVTQVPVPTPFEIVLTQPDIVLPENATDTVAGLNLTNVEIEPLANKVTVLALVFPSLPETPRPTGSIPVIGTLNAELSKSATDLASTERTVQLSPIDATVRPTSDGSQAIPSRERSSAYQNEPYPVTPPRPAIASASPGQILTPVALPEPVPLGGQATSGDGKPLKAPVSTNLAAPTTSLQDLTIPAKASDDAALSNETAPLRDRSVTRAVAASTPTETAVPTEPRKPTVEPAAKPLPDQPGPAARAPIPDLTSNKPQMPFQIVPTPPLTAVPSLPVSVPGQEVPSLQNAAIAMPPAEATTGAVIDVKPGATTSDATGTVPPLKQRSTEVMAPTSTMPPGVNSPLFSGRPSADIPSQKVPTLPDPPRTVVAGVAPQPAPLPPTPAQPSAIATPMLPPEAQSKWVDKPPTDPRGLAVRTDAIGVKQQQSAVASFVPPAVPVNAVTTQPAIRQSVPLENSADIGLSGGDAARSEAPKGDPAPPRAPDMPRSVAAQILDAARASTTSRAEITVTLEDLGRLRLSPGGTDTLLTVAIVADRPEATDFIRRNLDILMQEARAQGFANLDLDLSGGGQTGTGPRFTDPGTTEQHDDTPVPLLPNVTAPRAAAPDPGTLDLRL